MSAPLDPRVGLCSRCAHAHRVATPRSHFWLCGRSRSEPAYPRYPRLPVLTCPGYEPLPEGVDPAPGPPRDPGR